MPLTAECSLSVRASCTPWGHRRLLLAPFAQCDSASPRVSAVRRVAVPGEPFGLDVLATQLIRKSGHVADFIAAKLGRPFLAARRVIPRVEAWLVGSDVRSPCRLETHVHALPDAWTCSDTRRLVAVARQVSGAAHPSPKSLLLEYRQAWPMHAHGLASKPVEAWGVGADGVSPPAPSENPRGFVAGFTLDWPAGAPPCPGGTVSDDASGNRTLQMRTGIFSRKAASRQNDKVRSAEPLATVMLLQALQSRRREEMRLATAAAQAAALPAAAEPPAVFEVVKLLADPAAGSPDADAPSHADGTMLTVSYVLNLLPAEATQLPPTAQLAAEHDGTELERRINDRILLGGGVVAPEVEELLSGTPPGQQARALLNARLFRHSVVCRLEVTVHSAEPPEEEARELLIFNAPLINSGLPHGQERHHFIAQLVAESQPASVADVGCGEGKLLTHLVAHHTPVARLIGVDTLTRSLRKAGAKLQAARAHAVTTDTSYTPPHAALLQCDLSSLTLHCGLITLVEVIEHLDPPILAMVGTALLGRCQPHMLLVTTPNKEYNLNFIQPPDGWADGDPGLPPVGSYPLRNPDHRFEFTRREFREWAHALCSQHPQYTVSFRGVGGGSMDETVPYGVWRGPGPQTQVAIFTRTRGADGAADGDAVAAASRANAPLHEHEDAVVWQSEAAGVLDELNAPATVE
jgi:SAM-dependent methyltransferase